ncbi:ATP synthase subunit I [Ferrigenium sp. UT5]|uniref:ATP synthase subunit I n=1 Tax=Ferrigenium sp. UT5 TaxID=3242105 RepID=UPI0038B3FACF
MKESWESLTPQAKAAIIAALGEATAQEKRQISRLIAAQIIVACAVSGISFSFGAAPEISIAAWSGGGVSVLNSLLLAWRMSRASRSESHDAQLQLRLLYFYAVERFLSVVIALVLAMAVTKQPLVVLGGFVSGQAVMILARLFLQFRFR